MARPRRATSDAFYDVFADMPLSDQAAALRILEQVHRLAVREAGKPERRRIATLLDPDGVVVGTEDGTAPAAESEPLAEGASSL